MSDETKPPDPADAVLTITLYKADPHCLEYRFEVKSEYDDSAPEHIEQLNVLADIVNKYRERAERAALQALVMKKRELRKAQAQYMSSIETKGEVPS